MMALTYAKRQNLSLFLVLSMVFSMWLTVSPLSQANAGILGSVGNIAKTLFVNVGALAGGAMTAVLGAAVGGGPLGMAAGGVAGFFVTKKVLNWTTSSFANFATVAGAIGGGLLCAGMGFPMLAVGVLGGGLVSRLLVKGIGALVDKVTKGKTLTVSKADVVSDAAKAESDELAAYIAGLDDDSASTSAKKVELKTDSSSNSSSMIVDSRTAYDKYTAAYKKYVISSSNGDAAAATAAYKEYQTYMNLYQQLLKSGK